MEQRPTEGKQLSPRMTAFIRKVSPSMKVINTVSIVIALLLAVATIFMTRSVVKSGAQVYRTNETHQSCQNALDEFQESSDFLTAKSHEFVQTGDLKSLTEYIDDIGPNDRRSRALETLRNSSNSSEVTEALEHAKQLSVDLSQTELYAMRLAANARGTTDLPPTVSAIALSPEDLALSPEQQLEKAKRLVTGEKYAADKLGIGAQVQAGSNKLVNTLQSNLEQQNAELHTHLGLADAGLMSLVLVVAASILATTLFLLIPMKAHEASILNDEPLEPAGARELRYLTAAYNKMYEKNQTKTSSLYHEAHVDALTGMLNRASYDELLFENRHHCALILVDIDNFKKFNDEYGHEMGDAILIEVSATLFGSFRSNDHICRIGGDEFAVIMTEADSSMREAIERKLEKVSVFLRDTSNGLPSVTISVGVAYGTATSTVDELFLAADGALYETKRNGRDGRTFAS